MSRTYWNTVHALPFRLPMPHERQAFWPAYTLPFEGLGQFRRMSHVGFNPQPEPPRMRRFARHARFGRRFFGGGSRVGFNPQPDPPASIPPGIRAFRGAFGGTYTIKGPAGINIPITVPVEAFAADAAGAAVDAAWPAVQEKINAELPLLVNKALNQAQPRIRAEADRALDAGTSRAAMIATGVAVVVVGAAWWTRRAITKGR